MLYIDNTVNIDSYANTKTWLERFRGDLESRREAKRGVIQWCCLQWPRVKQELDKVEKIFLQRTRNEALKVRIVATIDNQSMYCTEGILVLIPIKANGISMRSLLAILNSKLINYLFATKFLNLAIKAEYLKQLRLPHLSGKIQNKLENLVDNVMSAKQSDPSTDTTALEDEIDFMVYKLYGLTYDEVLVVDPETPITREQYEAKKL